jgi:glucose/mannose-6-phosphate isomerase
MLDDQNVIKQRDPEDAISVASREYAQTELQVTIWNAENDERPITNIVVAGMGGSALAAVLVKVWLKNEITIPYEVLRSYDIPAYVGPNTLFIASSYSGNTEETISAMQQAEVRGSQLAIIASGGSLIDTAGSDKVAHVALPGHLQPRMAVIYNLRALIALLAHFGIVDSIKNEEIIATADWLKSESEQWSSSVPTEHNYAKQIALHAVGKTSIFYGGALTAPVAYKWKISWNENAKNVAFWNEYSEYDHNEFIGWTSHPVEKPYAIFDIVSHLEHPQILKRFDISDRLLSGKRPKAMTISLQGDTLIQQMLWGSILADFASIYVAILNGADPSPVALIEKLKQELV